ncbi:MAG: histone-lysine N-methyltransferase [Syntrophobacteraceae bacterium]|jgi:isopropylmalate/homocitrate/citramalate synthase|nr:histone-lysine N-methyltransferase [Syntrophobacteraceae bacterium]
MARWNPEKRVLEHQHSRHWRHRLVEISEPNLMREIFPYDEVPRIDFDHKLQPIDPAGDIFITDTTFRDGQQARPPYSVKQIETLFDFLHRLSGPRGVVRQSEFFLYTDKDREALDKCRAKGYRYPEITGWIRAVEQDLRLVADAGLDETGILTSVSDYHVFNKLKLDRAGALKKYLGIARAALDLGIKPRCHFEDITRADIYGLCIPFAIELMKLREESGVDIKIRLCDTLGFGISYPGAALPRSVPKLVRAFIDDAGVPGSLLEWHGHNDFHKVLVNAATAWLYGCAGANGTLLGFGERTGNAPIEGLVIEYIGLRGGDHGIDTTAITDMAQYFESELGYRVPPNYPFVGEEFNATRAGIHADGIVKDEEIYNIFDTSRLLKRPISIIITDKSGVASVAYWVNTRLKLEGERRLDKRNPGIMKMHKRVMREYEKGRNTSISNEELERWARRYLPEYFVSEFDLLKQRAHALAAHLVEEVVESEMIKTMDPARQEPLLQTLLELNPFIQYIYITDREGRKTTRNITHIVDKAKYESAKVGEDLSDRPWFIEPMKDGRVHVTDFYSSRYTGALCITVSAPIRDEADEITGILGIDMRFEDLAKMEQNGEI